MVVFAGHAVPYARNATKPRLLLRPSQRGADSVDYGPACPTPVACPCDQAPDLMLAEGDSEAARGYVRGRARGSAYVETGDPFVLGLDPVGDNPRCMATKEHTSYCLPCDRVVRWKSWRTWQAHLASAEHREYVLAPRPLPPDRLRPADLDDQLYGLDESDRLVFRRPDGRWIGLASPGDGARLRIEDKQKTLVVERLRTGRWPLLRIICRSSVRRRDTAPTATCPSHTRLTVDRE